MLVDVHAHLDHIYFSDKLDSVIKRARKNGVKKIITSSVNIPSGKKALEISKKYDIVECSLGLYPLDLLGEMPDETGLVRQIEPLTLDEGLNFIMKNKDRILAVGEVGMDFKFSKEEKEQKENFEKIIKFVEKLKKPIIVHSRNAERECLDLLESSKLKRVLLHCFSGKKSLIKRGYDLGYYFSVPAVINRLQHFQVLVELVDINKLLTETDCPWLSPYLNKKNEPAFVKEAINKISEIKNLNKKEVENIIFMNYQDLFLK